MKAFTFQTPPNILFEVGASRKLAELVSRIWGKADPPRHRRGRT